tara:strand:- start:9 stop:689 length:681 start_codon:yes stop_codon:yes gene_type:complete
MCGLRDPEQHADYEPDVPLDNLPAWAELNAHECALRERLGTVKLIRSLRRNDDGTVEAIPGDEPSDLRKITSTYEGSCGKKYHLHPNLVNKDDGTVELCRACHRAVQENHPLPPPLSIAAGVDFGSYLKLRLPELSELEQMLLSDIRMYKLLLKVAVLPDPKAPKRMQLRGHLIAFEHSGVDVTTRTLREQRAWVKNAFDVAFVGPDGTSGRRRVGGSNTLSVPGI